MTDRDRAPQWGDQLARVTKEEWLSTAIAAFVIGGLVGWALFGSPKQALEICKSIDLPQWIGAIATMFIGAGALLYARSEHRHRLTETRESWRKEEESKLRDLAHMRAKSKKGGWPKIEIDHYTENRGLRRTMRRLRRAVEIAVSDAEDALWTESERSCLTPRMVDIFSAYEFSLKQFISSGKELLRRSNDDDDIDEYRWVEPRLRRLVAEANDADEAADNLMDALDTEMGKQRRRFAALRKQLR